MLDAWQQFILETDGIGGDGVQSIPRNQPTTKRTPPTFEHQLCVEPYANGGYLLFVSESMPDRERLVTGLSGLEWVSNQGELFHFPCDKLQKIIYLTSNFPLRWGIPEYYKRGNNG